MNQRAQYLNAVTCLEEILDMGVVPIVNENDTICPAEIRFGDNDTLSAITAGMLKADYLFLLTDVDCLYTDNPRINPNAEPILVCHDIQALREKGKHILVNPDFVLRCKGALTTAEFFVVSVASRGSALGTGGMSTKLIAADLATAAGVRTVITRGATPENILEIIKADDEGKLLPHEENGPILSGMSALDSELPLHTLFTAKNNPLYDRKWWILHGLHTAGRVYVDQGAVKAVTSMQRSSLFSAGILEVQGNFVAQQAVEIIGRKIVNGQTAEVKVGKGLVNYSSIEINRIRGCRSSEITNILGYMDAECVIHRDNLVLTFNKDDTW